MPSPSYAHPVRKGLGNRGVCKWRGRPGLPDRRTTGQVTGKICGCVRVHVHVHISVNWSLTCSHCACVNCHSIMWSTAVSRHRWALHVMSRQMSSRSLHLEEVSHDGERIKNIVKLCIMTDSGYCHNWLSYHFFVHEQQQPLPLFAQEGVQWWFPRKKFTKVSNSVPAMGMSVGLGWKHDYHIQSYLSLVFFHTCFVHVQNYMELILFDHRPIQRKFAKHQKLTRSSSDSSPVSPHKHRPCGRYALYSNSWYTGTYAYDQ